MKKTSKVILLILMLTSIFTTIGCEKTKQTTSSQDKVEANKKVEIKLDRDNAINVNYNNDDYKKILNLFSTNELQAKNTYLNKTLKITGEAKKITKDNDENIIVHVITKDNLYGANLYFKDTKENEDKIMNLKLYDDSKGYYETVRGDVITAYGYFEEYKSGQSVSDGSRINITYCELT